MCASCVAQGVTYIGGALGALQLMARRARRGRTTVTTGRAEKPGQTAAAVTPPPR